MHKTNWERFPAPWDKIGPRLQAQLRVEVTEIVKPKPPEIKKDLTFKYSMFKGVSRYRSLY